MEYRISAISGFGVRTLILLALSLVLSACASSDSVTGGSVNADLTTEMPVVHMDVIKSAELAEKAEENADDAGDSDVAGSSPVESNSWEKRLPDFTLDGLSLNLVDTLLGPESLRREEIAGHIRRYDGVDCQLYLVVFDGKIDHIEARDSRDGSLQNAEECGKGLARVATRQVPASF